MLIYLFGLFILFISGFLFKNKRLGYVAIFFLIFISMFRGEKVGLDTIEYVDPHYYTVRTEVITGLNRFEFSNYIIDSLIPITGNYTGIWIYTLVLFIFLILACKRFKINQAYAIFFFVIFNYFNLSLNISRQFAAIAIVLYSFSFLMEDKIKKYLFFPLVVFAASFHISAIIVLPLFFIRRLNLSKVKPKILTSIIIGVYFVMQMVGQRFVEFVNMYSLSLDEDMQNWSDYFDQARDDYRSIVGILLGLITYFFDTYILIRINKITNQSTQLISLLFFLGIIISMLFNNVYGNLGRLRYYFEIINIIAFSYYYLYDKSKEKLVITFMMIAFFGIIYFRNLVATDAYGTIPYYLMF